MELKLKFSEFIRTASHSSPHSNNEIAKSKQDSTDSPIRGSENQASLRFSDSLCNGLQISLGYLIRDTLNLDPQKRLEQTQNEIKATEMRMHGVISDLNTVDRINSEPQTAVAEHENRQDGIGCCPCHCIIS